MFFGKFQEAKSKNGLGYFFLPVVYSGFPLSKLENDAIS
tara:strand:- start:662 stop:778 length:117 start_codon:yes stop_codon:yes gene_type:complete